MKEIAINFEILKEMTVAKAQEIEKDLGATQ